MPLTVETRGSTSGIGPNDWIHQDAEVIHIETSSGQRVKIMETGGGQLVVKSMDMPLALLPTGVGEVVLIDQEDRKREDRLRQLGEDLLTIGAQMNKVIDGND